MCVCWCGVGGCGYMCECMCMSMCMCVYVCVHASGFSLERVCAAQRRALYSNRRGSVRSIEYEQRMLVAYAH